MKLLKNILIGVLSAALVLMLFSSYNETQKKKTFFNKHKMEKKDDSIIDIYLLNNNRVIASNIQYLEKLKSRYAIVKKDLDKKLDSLNRIPGGCIPGIKANTIVIQNLMRIKNSIKVTNKAYDDQYAKLILGIDKELKIIRDEIKVSSASNWYDEIGGPYYQLMVEKYQRK